MSANAAAEHGQRGGLGVYYRDELSMPDDMRPRSDNRLEERRTQQSADATGLTALLQHLHSKITSFEAERVSWLSRFEAARLSQAARASAVRSLREINTEMLDLGRAVSECRVQTWEAKMQRMELQRENKELEHIKTVNQAQRTEELAAVFDIAEAKQVINHRKGQKPQKVTKFTMNEVNTKSNRPNDLSLKQSKNFQTSGKRPQGRFEAMTEPEKKIKAMYKTVVIPKDLTLGNHNDDSLDNHVALATFKSEETLRKEEHNRVLEDNLNLLRDEIDNRSDEFSKHREAMSQKLQLTDQKHQQLEKLTRKLNDEYFDQRRNHDFKIKRLQEEKELLKLKGISLEYQHQEALKNKTLENHITKDLAEKRAKEYASQFKSKSLRKEETLEIVREQYKKVKVIYGEKLIALDINLGMMRDATNSMKLGKERAIKREKAANYQARQMLKRLEYEIEARSKGQYLEKEVDQPDYEDDLDEETINLDDLDQLNYKMKSIEKKLMAA